MAATLPWYSYTTCQSHLQDKARQGGFGQLQTGQPMMKLRGKSFLEAMPRHMTDKGVTGNIQNRFNETNLRTGSDETSVLLDEVKAAEASADF